MVDAAREETDPVQLVEGIRQRIGALIVQTLVPVKMPLPVLTLDPGLESLLNPAVRAGPDASHTTEPRLAAQHVQAVADVARPLPGEAPRLAVVTTPITPTPHPPQLAPPLPRAPAP